MLTCLTETIHTNYDHSQELGHIFNFTNLIIHITCFTLTVTHPSLIDIILTNRARSLQSGVAIETSPSDHHRMVKDANLGAIVSLSDDPNSVYSHFCAHFKFIDFET